MSFISKIEGLFERLRPIMTEFDNAYRRCQVRIPFDLASSKFVEWTAAMSPATKTVKHYASLTHYILPRL